MNGTVYVLPRVLVIATKTCTIPDDIHMSRVRGSSSQNRSFFSPTGFAYGPFRRRLASKNLRSEDRTARWLSISCRIDPEQEFLSQLYAFAPLRRLFLCPGGIYCKGIYSM